MAASTRPSTYEEAVAQHADHLIAVGIGGAQVRTIHRSKR